MPFQLKQRLVGDDIGCVGCKSVSNERQEAVGYRQTDNIDPIYSSLQPFP
jgi:hypothetical protein